VNATSGDLPANYLAAMGFTLARLNLDDLGRLQLAPPLRREPKTLACEFRSS